MMHHHFTPEEEKHHWRVKRLTTVAVISAVTATYIFPEYRPFCYSAELMACLLWIWGE